MTDRDFPVISSSGNSVVKRTRSLLRRKGRYEERAFLVEGTRAVFDTFVAGCPVEVVLLRADATMRDQRERLPAEVPVRIVEAATFDAMSDVAHSQGIMATVSMDSLPHSSLDGGETNPFLLIVDGVKDPGNLGTLIRSAAAGGVSEVLLTPETVDPFNPKCVRASMGAHFRIPLVHCLGDDLATRVQSLPLIALAEARGRTVYSDVDWTGASAVIVGGEADGASDISRSLATMTVSIPLSVGMESLNAGVAGSLLIFEAARQRRHA